MSSSLGGVPTRPTSEASLQHPEQRRDFDLVMEGGESSKWMKRSVKIAVRTGVVGFGSEEWAV